MTASQDASSNLADLSRAMVFLLRDKMRGDLNIDGYATLRSILMMDEMARFNHTQNGISELRRGAGFKPGPIRLIAKDIAHGISPNWHPDGKKKEFIEKRTRPPNTTPAK